MFFKSFSLGWYNSTHAAILILISNYRILRLQNYTFFIRYSKKNRRCLILEGILGLMQA
jgi:hypothetical protein